MSKIEAAFPNNGRKLFESERAAVEAFQKKYCNLIGQRQEAKKAILEQGNAVIEQTQEFFDKDYIIYR